MSATEKFPIEYSCYLTKSRAGEKFSNSHALSYIVSGAMILTDEYGEYEISAGESFFFTRNSLVKYAKYPPEGGIFKSITLFLDQSFLRNLALELKVEPEESILSRPFGRLKNNSLTADYMRSLLVYEKMITEDKNSALLDLKRKEAVLILISENPGLKNILFNFSAPGKIDLEGFMKKNFHFKVDLSRFAFISGRSLSTFKRDFEKIFHTTPNRWLLDRRLDEAQQLIHSKHQKISDVYSEVGFEDLSHFSVAYKKRFGIPPSMDHKTMLTKQLP